MNSIDKLAAELQKAIANGDNGKKKGYDTQAEVTRLDGNTVWVKIAGSDDETPVSRTNNANVGDNVLVRVSGGRAWLMGNQTSPATDDTVANKANQQAYEALGMAATAGQLAELARTAADSAMQSAEQASSAAASATADAATARTKAEQATSDAAEAKASAESALTSAQNAQKSADSALISLSNVEDVVGVLEWITAHGTMTANGSAALDPSKVYFIVDANGDYVVGGTHYSIVSEPKAEDRTSYYTLSVDESVQNYIATHVVVDTEGLWLIPDAGGNKVLIATGAGSSYTTAGTYIIGKVNGVDTVFAKFVQTGATMNATNSTQIAHLGYGSGNAESGTATAPYYALGEFRTNYINDYSSSSTYEKGDMCSYGGNTYVCKENITTPEAWNADHWSISIGNYSIIEGTQLIASGSNSHAEGRYTSATGHFSHAEGGPLGAPVPGPQAIGECSHAEGGGAVFARGTCAHAEGLWTQANGYSSHAQNNFTIANGADQTALGKYNVADTTSAVIIGNGTADNARSNALTIDWNGNVNIASGAKYKINGTALTASDVGALSSSTTYVSGVKGNSESSYRSGQVNITAANVGAVPTSRTVNSKALSSNITLAPSDLGINDYITAQSQASTSYGDGVWRWREWNSGKVEIWYHGSLTLTTSESDSNGVKRYSRWFNFPNSYSLYRCTVIVNGMQEGAWYGCGGTRDSSSTVGAEPTRSFQIMGYRIYAQPPTAPTNLNIYICGQKTV